MEIKYYIGSMLNMPKNHVLINPINGDLVFDLLLNKEFEYSYHVKEYLNIIYHSKINNGGLALRQITDYHTLYNITLTNRYWEKPNIDYLEQSLYSLKDQMETHNEKVLCIPRSTCMIEKFEWITVFNMLNNIFKETDITIYICNY